MPAISEKRTVAVIGAGAAGLAAAETLARLGASVEVVEKRAVTGGHAAHFTCKATDTCVKCGACLVNDLQRRTAEAARIRFHLNSAVERTESGQVFRVSLANEKGQNEFDADAILIAIGFKIFDARNKPYGYGYLENVLTNFDLEQRLKNDFHLKRPSDGKIPETIAFIQCVGSRDAQLRHLWCSKFCCASSLRMAQRIRHLHPQTKVTVFYIDIQTFGKEFQAFYDRMRRELVFVRAIPGDITDAEGNGCKVSYFDPSSGRSEEAVFDMVVLSSGITPSTDHQSIARLLKLPLSAEGFFQEAGQPAGIFSAGAAVEPMTIAESVASGTRAAWQIAEYLRQRGKGIEK